MQTVSFPRKNAFNQYKMFIGGDWVDPKGSRVYENLNPAHKRLLLGNVAEATAGEVDAAFAAALHSFDSWRRVSGNTKTKLFLQLAQALYRNYDRIIETITCEMGKSHFDAKLDLDEAIGVVEAVAPQGLSMKGETYQANIRGIVMESRPEPRGVAAIITPFNFPVAIPIAQVVSALVTGNTVVWKPSHLIPESSQAVIACIEEAISWVEQTLSTSIPRGILNMVTGDSDTGRAIVGHPAYKALSFTGSKDVGDAVDSAASAMGKRVMKEVGGINCFYVHRDADISRAACNFVYGKTITAGQRCTSIQEVLVDDVVYEEFVSAAMEEAQRIVQGDGASAEIARAHATPGSYALTPLVSEEARQRVFKLVEQSVAQGASVRYTKPVDPQLNTEGFYAPFTMLENVHPGNVLYSTEIFGPVAVITRVVDLDEAIQIINDKIGIVACIDSRNKDASETFIQDVLRTRVDDGRHGTGAFWATKFGGDRGAGSGNPALDENMVYGYVLWKTIYRAYTPLD